jgi:hypothetical protein
MRLLSVLFILICFASFAQPITIKIDTLTATDSIPDSREFKLTYNVINNTSDTLKLFFKSNDVSTSEESQNAKFAYYKIYEGDLFINIGTIFSTKVTSSKRFPFKDSDENKSKEDFENTYIDFLKQEYQTSWDAIKKIYKEEGFEGLLKFEEKNYVDHREKLKMHYQVLNPNQKIERTATFYWDKKRYYFRDPHEFYLDVSAKHYFELTFVALKEEFKDRIDEDLYAKIKDDPNFIKGVFISNKVEINLKPD